jgi:L-alanine-DL-glutamate epimerase-like enolase superfamily enzyme
MLVLNPDETFDRLAQRFLAEGFRQIKVRIAVSAFDHDLARLKRLRAMAGPDISIAADANGAWDVGEAVEKLRVLEPGCPTSSSRRSRATGPHSARRLPQPRSH